LDYRWLEVVDVQSDQLLVAFATKLIDSLSMAIDDAQPLLPPHSLAERRNVLRGMRRFGRHLSSAKLSTVNAFAGAAGNFFDMPERKHHE
jgi:hypothetical protein